MKKLWVQCFAAITLMATAMGIATAASYQVELIVFSHLDSRGVSQEQWPIIQPPIPTNNNYQPLPSSDFVLRHEQAEFVRNGVYKTLLHTAWRQDFFGGPNPPIHISGGANEDTVNGSVRVSRNHYFDVKFNLYFAVPERKLARLDTRHYFRNSNNLMYFHLTETRRMKSKQINYIDHPLFGVLIKIIPLKT